MHAVRRLLHGAPGYVWVNKEEIEALAAALKLDVAEFEKRYVRRVGIRRSLIEFPNGDCVFFHGESRTCQVYEARPRQCRTWPFWNSNLARPEAWQQAARALSRLQSRQAGGVGEDRGAEEHQAAVMNRGLKNTGPPSLYPFSRRISFRRTYTKRPSGWAF